MTLLATKLRRPSLPARWVERLQLTKRLNEGLELNHQLTLVSAPAGFGKTTCINAWTRTLGGLPVSWFSLDPEDNDPGRFFSYLLAAIQEVDGTLGQDLARVLRSGQLPDTELVGTILVNDLLGFKGRLLLAMDDFHVLQDQFILRVMETLITSAPPSLHLVLLTREDPPLPLARIRAGNGLTEIRAQDLLFSPEDTDRFLNGTMSLSLARADIAALEEKTEGWIAGLQLAALALQAPSPQKPEADRSSFIRALSGSHRLILSYLTEQVLGQQPADVRQFLLETSVLDKLNGDLCDAVTGRSNSHELLERLFRANLFLIPLDDDGRWYRYHHLFADLLRGLQSAYPRERTAELHRRAGRWYAQTGDQGPYAAEAIKHALAAEDYKAAVQLLESHSMDMIMQGHARMVHDWLASIPPKWALQSPKTGLAFAWMHLLRGAYAEAAPYLDRTEAALADPARELCDEECSLRSEWLVQQSLLLYKEGRTAESIDTATEAVAIAPETDYRVRAFAYWGLAAAYQAQENYARAVEAHQLAIQHGRTAENWVAEMMSTSGLAQLTLERGQLRLSFQIASQAVERLERSSVLPPISTGVYGALGTVHYQWNQLDQARHQLLRALELSTLGGYNNGKAGCEVLLSRLFLLEGDVEAAARELQRAVDLLQAGGPDYVRQEVIAQQVALNLVRDYPAAAHLALQGCGISSGTELASLGPQLEEAFSYSLGLLYCSILRVVLYEARAGSDVTHVGTGVELANRLIDAAHNSQCVPITVEALLLRAQLHAYDRAAESRETASRQDYLRALKLGEPEGFIGVFLEQGPPVAAALAELFEAGQLGNVSPDYVAGLLAAFSSSHWGTPTGRQLLQGLPTEAGNGTLAEPLTERELEVLHLIAEGLMYKEIGARLFISLNTVRSHVKAIYGKLGVSNRTKATERARHLRIL